MLNSVALNVVLGLILIYLLYSLLCTLLSEIVATSLGIRARMLRLAIDRMLTDDFDGEYMAYRALKRRYRNGKTASAGKTVSPPPSGMDSPASKKAIHTYLQQRQKAIDHSKKKYASLSRIRMRYMGRAFGHHVRRLVMAKPAHHQYSLAGRFYNYPSIKYLAEHSSNIRAGLFESTLPAYISAGQFASTIIAMMSDKGQGPTQFDTLEFCVRYNTLHMEYQTRTQFRQLLASSSGSVEVFNKKLQDWFKETMNRSTGWYKRRIRTILFILGFLLAATFNIDSLYIASTLSKDSETSRQLSELSMQVARDTSLRKMEANTDSTRVWAESAAKSGTPVDSNYSRLTTYLLASGRILGLGWDTRDRYTTYAHSWDADDSSVSSALRSPGDTTTFGRLKRRRQSLVANLQDDRHRMRSALDSGRDELRNLVLSRIPGSDTPRYRRLMDTLRRETYSYEEAYRIDTLNYLSTRDSIALVSDSIGTRLGVHRLLVDSLGLNKAGLHIWGRQYFSLGQTLWFYLVAHPWRLNAIVGFLLTALAVSLGAPFWFNLLVKIASIRGSGIRPEDAAKTPGELDPFAGLPDSFGGGGPGGGDGQVVVATTTMTTVTTAETGGGLGPEWDVAVAKVSATLTLMPGFIRATKGWKGGGNKKTGPDKTPAIEIQVLDDKAMTAAKKLLKEYRCDYPLTYKLNTHAVAHAASSGNTVWNDGLPHEVGTLGCFATRRDMPGLFLLSCWHVLKGDYDYENATVSNRNVEIYNNGTATLNDGCLTKTIDVAFAQLANPDGVVNNFALNYRSVTVADARTTPVSFTGASSGDKNGFVDMHSNSASLKYPDGKFYPLTDVIQICSYDANFVAHPISAPGDSGSVVIDSSGYPLGLVVGGDANYTYVVKFSNFLDPQTGMYKEYVLYI